MVDAATEPLTEEEGVDAVALFRPVRPDALTPFLDLDDDAEESNGIYAEALEDGSFLLYTFQPFEAFTEDPSVAHAWLAQFGEALAEVHEDPRGVMFFPDDVEPEATTYEGVIEEVGDDAFWVSLAGGIDVDALRALAGQLLEGIQGQFAALAPDSEHELEPPEPPESSPEKGHG